MLQKHNTLSLQKYLRLSIFLLGVLCSTVFLQASDLKRIVRTTESEKLQRLLRVCTKHQEVSPKHFTKAMTIAFFEDHPTRIMGYLLRVAHQRGIKLEKNKIMKEAIKKGASLAIIDYLLRKNVYNPKMRIGKQKYPFRELVGRLWSRLWRSITVQPFWLKILTTYILPLPIIGPLVGFIIFLLKFKKVQRFFRIKDEIKEKIVKFSKILGWISLGLKIVKPLWNGLVILVVLSRFYQPSYMMLALESDRPEEEKLQLIKRLYREGMDLHQNAFLLIPKGRGGIGEKLLVYTFVYKGLIHLAIEKNYLSIVKFLYEKDPTLFQAKSYTLEDPTPSTQEGENAQDPQVQMAQPALLPEFLTIQALYYKRSKKFPKSITVKLPRDFVRDYSGIFYFFQEEGIIEKEN